MVIKALLRVNVVEHGVWPRDSSFYQSNRCKLFFECRILCPVWGRYLCVIRSTVTLLQQFSDLRCHPTVYIEHAQ